MVLNIYVDEQVYELDVPEFVIDEAEEMFAGMDRDMDQGWQMSRTWIQNPDRVNRCQITADKLLTALQNENEKLGMLMAGYIVKRMPGVTGIRMSTEGDMLEHELLFDNQN